MADKSLLLIFPHQLFINHKGLSLNPSKIAIIEDNLFFGDLRYTSKFHKQKLWLHRASMKRYEEHLSSRGFRVDYLDHQKEKDTLKEYLAQIDREAFTEILSAELHDFMLSKRLRRICKKLSLELKFLPSELFLNSHTQNSDYRSSKKRWFMGDFYKHQRKRLDLLMDGEQPLGGKWSFDEENRKKVPKKLLSEIPQIAQIERDEIDLAAKKHIQEKYPSNPGEIENLIYPSSHDEARKWLKDFLDHRFKLFGDFEDAIVKGENYLWHSVLTPVLNTGLITPTEIISELRELAIQNEVPLNSLEGFIRQIIGWREFVRATYEDIGVKMRSTNHWQHKRKISSKFYDASTGIEPVDDVIRRILKTGYCHHIERLMVLGGFMFLCELDPNDIYLWFMEMFVDSYDWVMVPNVYGMSQNADGGLITTKPYFSGSSYLKKMSNYKNGEWARIWDGLYWRWIIKHSENLAKNPRWAMMCAMARKMDEEKKQAHIEVAEGFLSAL